jgi:hypothetical protein
MVTTLPISRAARSSSSISSRKDPTGGGGLPDGVEALIREPVDLSDRVDELSARRGCGNEVA